MFYKCVVSAVVIVMVHALVKRIIRAEREIQHSVEHYLHSSLEGLLLPDCPPCPAEEKSLFK